MSLYPLFEILEGDLALGCPKWRIFGRGVVNAHHGVQRL